MGNIYYFIHLKILGCRSQILVHHYYQKGRLALDNHNWAVAVNFFQKVIKKAFFTEVDRASAYYYLGVSQQKLGESHLAYRSFQRGSLSLHPTLFNPKKHGAWHLLLSELASISAEKDHFSSAFNLLDRAIPFAVTSSDNCRIQGLMTTYLSRYFDKDTKRQDRDFLEQALHSSYFKHPKLLPETHQVLTSCLFNLCNLYDDQIALFVFCKKLIKECEKELEDTHLYCARLKHVNIINAREMTVTIPTIRTDLNDILSVYREHDFLTDIPSVYETITDMHIEEKKEKDCITFYITELCKNPSETECLLILQGSQYLWEHADEDTTEEALLAALETHRSHQASPHLCIHYFIIYIQAIRLLGNEQYTEAAPYYKALEVWYAAQPNNEHLERIWNYRGELYRDIERIERHIFTLELTENPEKAVHQFLSQLTDAPSIKRFIRLFAETTKQLNKEDDVSQACLLYLATTPSGTALGTYGIMLYFFERYNDAIYFLSAAFTQLMNNLRPCLPPQTAFMFAIPHHQLIVDSDETLRGFLSKYYPEAGDGQPMISMLQEVLRYYHRSRNKVLFKNTAL